MLGLAALMALRAGNLWVGVTHAGAAEGELAAEPPPPHPSSPADERLLEKLGERRAALDRREEALITREALLAAAEAEINRRLAEMSAQEGRLAALEQERADREGAELARLSDAYQRMKPRDAARIFETMEPDLLEPVAAGMRTQALAAVMGEMDPAKARELTALLAAGRNASKSQGR
jgi:flagellar motility protein MotE (MotC chaperone)